MAVNLRNKGKSHVFPEQETPLQVVRWTNNIIQATTSGTSARTALPSGASLVEIRCTENVYLKFGDVTVVAAADNTSSLFLAGTQVVPVPLDSSGDPETYIAYIQESAAGTLQVEEVQ